MLNNTLYLKDKFDLGFLKVSANYAMLPMSPIRHYKDRARKLSKLKGTAVTFVLTNKDSN